MGRREIAFNPFGVTVKFSESEQAAMRELARLRQAPKNGHATARDKRIMDHRDNVETHLIGLLGEYAVARLLSVPFDESAMVAGDLVKDIVINGVTVEVKTLRGYLAFRQLEDFKADVAVLVWHKPGITDRVSVQGWVDRPAFVAGHFMDDFGYGPRPCMQPAQLHAISTLKTYCLLLGMMRKGASNGAIDASAQMGRL